MNYYELFGLPASPSIDRTDLSKKYFELQKKSHPDFYTNESEEEKENALVQSAAINKAFMIFKDPDKTIEYYLQLKGIITSDEKYQLPPDFLMEMMELNESFDGDEEQAAQHVAEFERSLEDEVSPLLFPEHPGTFTPAELQQMKAYYYKKKYLKRILERLDD